MKVKKKDKNMITNDLVDEAIKKDEVAFSTLINLIEQEMYQIAKIKLDDNYDDIYDAIQETIILIYKNLKKLKNKEYFRTWAMRILINECTKIINKKKKRNEKHLIYIENIEIEKRNLENIDSKQDFERLLDCLNEMEKIAITLYYKEKFNVREISEILQEPEGTIKSQISRAKNKIKKYIEEKCIYE